MKIPHPRGEVELTADGFGLWEGRFDLNGDEVSVEVEAEVEALDDDEIALVRRFVGDIVGHDTRARGTLSAPHHAVINYIAHHVDEFEHGTDLIGDPADTKGFVTRLKLGWVRIDPTDPDECATFDYTIDADRTNYLLSVRFSSSGDVSSVEMDS